MSPEDRRELERAIRRGTRGSVCYQIARGIIVGILLVGLLVLVTFAQRFI